MFSRICLIRASLLLRISILMTVLLLSLNYRWFSFSFLATSVGICQAVLTVFQVVPQTTRLLWSHDPTSKHLISQFGSLFSVATPSLHIKIEWIKDIGVEISAQLWLKGLNRIKACSINVTLQLIQFKVFRLYFSKTKPTRIFPSVSCDKCTFVDSS